MAFSAAAGRRPLKRCFASIPCKCAPVIEMIKEEQRDQPHAASRIKILSSASSSDSAFCPAAWFTPVPYYKPAPQPCICSNTVYLAGAPYEQELWGISARPCHR